MRFSHPAPLDVSAHEDHFAAPLRWGASHSALVLDRGAEVELVSGESRSARVVGGSVVAEVAPHARSGAKITTPGGEETPAVLVQCRTSDPEERARLRDLIRDRVRSITGMNCVVELVGPRTLPRTSSGKLSRAKARNLYLSGELQPLAA